MSSGTKSFLEEMNTVEWLAGEVKPKACGSKLCFRIGKLGVDLKACSAQESVN